MNYVLGVDVHSVNNPGDQSADAQVTDPNWKTPEVVAANWKAVFDTGVRFAFIKATEDTWEDRNWSKKQQRPINLFAERWRYAKEAGLLRGAYHFLHPEKKNMAEQADVFIQTVKATNELGELPPVLDLETASPQSWPGPHVLLPRIKEWLDRVADGFGRKPVIYARTSQLQELGLLNAPWGMEYDLWLAQYPWMPGTQKEYHDPFNPPRWSDTFPTQPAGYQPWKFWQFTAHGKMNGFGREDVDIDVFKGTFEELLEWAGLSVAPKPVDVVINTDVRVPVSPSYAVQAGDTLVSIAQKMNVDLIQLLELNNDILLKADMQLKLPGIHHSPSLHTGGGGTFTSPSTLPATIDYMVKPADSLSEIAFRFGTTPDAIMALNSQIKNPNIIVDGWVLKIPKV